MKCKILIDWLTFTVKREYDPRRVITWYLGMDSCLFQEKPYGLDGYQHCLEYNHIKVLYEPREDVNFQDMGCCVQMSGKGCRAFETYSKLPQSGDAYGAWNDEQGTGNAAFPCLFQLLAAGAATHDINVSRIDLACDDHDGALDMDVIVDAAVNNNINSRMAKRQIVQSFDGTQRNGTTVYLGAPSSNFRVRIYDKAKEQGDMVSHWIRVELVIKGKNALAFVENFVNCEEVGKLASGIINDKFSFIERDDINISRCSKSGWWVEFLENVDSVELLSREVVQHDIDEIEEWAVRQCAPALGMLFKAKGSVWLHEYLKDGVQRLNTKQLKVLADYQTAQKKRLKDISA